ncbi:MAG: hypothetical protein ACRD2N_20780 [Vicinamibacterales bacterium]
MTFTALWRAGAVWPIVWASSVAIHADIILSASGLNDTLKKMQRLQQTIVNPATAGAERADAWFLIGMEADGLAALINDEVAAHGSQEKPLIDLAVSRTGELGLRLSYDTTKKRFFYDNAAFREYLAAAPRGGHAAEASFKLIEGDFFRSSATDVPAILAAAERKRAFLRQYRSFAGAVEVHLMLSVDYRDLFRHYQTSNDTTERNRYRDLLRQELRLLMKTYPRSEQAEIARRMLKRFEEDLRARP